MCGTGRKNSFPILHFLIKVLSQYILFVDFSLVFTTEENKLKDVKEKSALNNF